MTLDTLHGIYTNEMNRIETVITRQKEDALRAYSLNLTKASEALKKKGDMAAYAVVEQERKRFRRDKNVETNAPNSFIAEAFSTYRQQVAAAQVFSDRMTVVLLKTHLKALAKLTKELMARGPTNELKAVNDEKRAAMAVFAELEKRSSHSGPPTTGASGREKPPPSVGTAASDRR